MCLPSHRQFLDLIEEFVFDDSRKGVLVDNFSNSVFPEISPVGESPCACGMCEILSFAVGKFLLLEIFDDLVCRHCPLGIKVKDDFYEFGIGFLDDISSIFSFVAECRGSSVDFPIDDILRHSPFHFLGKVLGIVFGDSSEKRVEKDAFRSVGDVLRGGDHIHPLFFKMALYWRESSLFLENRSSFHTRTMSKILLEGSETILWESGLSSVLADNALSI